MSTEAIEDPMNESPNGIEEDMVQLNVKVKNEFRKDLKLRAIEKDVTMQELLLGYLHFAYDHDPTK